MKTVICRKYSFQKLTQFSLGNNALGALLVKQMESFERYLYFFNLHEKANLEQNKPFSTLKTMICRKYFFHKLTQYSQGKNALDTSTSNTDGCLGEMCFIISAE
jgi:hypothetical protein